MRLAVEIIPAHAPPPASAGDVVANRGGGIAAGLGGERGTAEQQQEEVVTVEAVGAGSCAELAGVQVREQHGVPGQHPSPSYPGHPGAGMGLRVH
jgi:hypothetical protein